MVIAIVIFVLLFCPIQNISSPNTHVIVADVTSGENFPCVLNPKYKACIMSSVIQHRQLSYNKILSKWNRLRLRPIRVFCFHQVSDFFDESTMYREDWMQTVEFQNTINSLRNDGYTFISLPEAYEKLKYDTFRFRKYAVLTADDGWASLRNILPWLNEQRIPVTLFLNPAYLDGKHFRERETEEYLTENEVKQLHELYPLLTIGSHGWEHIDFYKQTEDEFTRSIVAAKDYLRTLPNYIPFFAFPYGDYSLKYANIVRSHHLIPLTVLGGKNYLEQDHIDRELLGC